MTVQPVNLVTHPLVQHKLTLMRQRDRSIKGFRELLNEIGMLLGYEVTRDLPHGDGRDRNTDRDDAGSDDRREKADAWLRSCAPASAFSTA